ncbi:hypothetical protein LSM04_000047 [Trypanosoma melophagium]|uniref:uncharacterized protein n=1 Tax=Trypanosoma melophagium TaxID=715481 RepID=UPI00351A9978|nr:hypothetical protein LSM04_000047 [Trypanosoma melophagium]
MCDIIHDPLKGEETQNFFNENADMTLRKTHNGAVFKRNTGHFTAPSVVLSEKTDECSDTAVDGEDGVSLLAAVGTQESPNASSLHWMENYDDANKTEVLLRPAALKKQDSLTPITMEGAFADSPMMIHSLFTDNTAADLSPTLLTAFLSYSDEMTMTVPSDAAFDFIKKRLFPSGHFPSPCIAEEERQERRKGTISLSWFLQQHREHAATVLSMGFRFLLNLEKYSFSWKRAVEVPLMALQLLARYAYAVTFDGHPNTFTALNPREHLLLMAACLLACWKFADVDASVTVLIAILEHAFFHQHTVLQLRDVIHMELTVFGVCGMCVEAPRWWTLAMELLAVAHSEMEEESSNNNNNNNNNNNSITHSFEEKLELLLITSEQILLTVINVDDNSVSGSEEKEKERKGKEEKKNTLHNMNTHNNHHPRQLQQEDTTHTVRLAELHTTLRCWMESHPVFGVALAVASGVVSLSRAAAYIAPTAAAYNLNNNNNNNKGDVNEEESSQYFLFPLSNTQRGIQAADDAVQRELCGMVEVLTEVLQTSWREN